MKTNVAVSIENVSKCYPIYSHPIDRLKQAISPKHKQYFQEFWALHNINFEINKGEAVGIIGRNGSGKSTLLQLICKTLTPTTGSIETKGRIAALLELGAGFNPEFTGRENVYINGAILGFNKREIESRFDSIVSFADIGAFIDRPVKTYSSGMFVRLAFAVQICVEPDILIIDEALAVGDIFFQQKCYKQLNKLLDNGTTIILVSHVMTQVEQFCQRALLLKNGNQVFAGKANEAVRKYYLLQQEDNAIEQPQNSLEQDAIQELIEPLSTWPSDAAFLNIIDKTQITNEWAKCIRVALCDGKLNPCSSFQQGETAYFYYEFEFLHDTEIPIIATALVNQQGLIVHAKSTLEYGSDVPSIIKKGEHLYVKHAIKLELAIGGYTFEPGLGTINLSDYQHRNSMHFTELYSKMIRLCNLPNVGTFTILPRLKGVPVQLLHHGIANLSGHCQVSKEPSVFS
jgi:lipopolysaccharide transport system ATP-binding protein